MNTLIIGNGFDKAHNLPTDYKDFLSFVTEFRKVKNVGFWVNGALLNNVSDDERISMLEKKGSKYWDEFEGLIASNFWLDYFEGEKQRLGDKWLNFESEIEEVVKRTLKEKEKNPSDVIENIAFRQVREFQQVNHIITFSVLFDTLYQELRRFTRMFEIYLDAVIPEMWNGYKIPEISGLKVDRLVSFNYTCTYTEHYYSSLDYVEYIHGEAKLSNTVDSCNLVMGFDDHYFEDTKADTSTVPFEKYYQRIVKETGNHYLKWKTRAPENENGQYIKKDKDVIYFFGHSLSPMDGDVIRFFMLKENAMSYIYYLDERDRAEKIKNLAVVLGAEQLIKMTAGTEKSITFIKLTKMTGER